MEAKAIELVRKLAECQAACRNCFKHCLREKDLHMMVGCIKMDIECSDICSLALSAVASEWDSMEDVLRICARVCRECAAECAKHPYDHCQKCKTACEECARACESFVQEG